jgi:hypothetical protein
MDTQRAVVVTKGLLWLHKGTVVAKQVAMEMTRGCGGHTERLWWLHREPVVDAQRDRCGYTGGRRDSHKGAVVDTWGGGEVDTQRDCDENTSGGGVDTWEGLWWRSKGLR